MVLQADASSEDQMEMVIDKTIKQFGKLNGVIHAAGILGPKAHRTITETGIKECMWQFVPKALGVYVLEKVLENHSVDFCFLFSSSSAILGGLGFTAYASANIFMDVFTYRHNQTSPIPWTSINWGIVPQEKIGETFFQILALETTAHVVVESQDFQEKFNKWVKKEFLQNKDSSQEKQTTLQARPNLKNLYVAPKSDLEKGLSVILGDVLGFEKVGIYDNLFDLGGDSLHAIRIVANIQKEFKVNIALTDLLTSPTASDLAKVIEAHKTGKKLQKLSTASRTYAGYRNTNDISCRKVRNISGNPD